MRLLTLGEVLALHRRILAETGGVPGVRDLHAIASAVAQQRAPSRLLAAQTIINLISPSSRVVFVGGDLNAFSGFGPQDHDDNPATPDFSGSTAEVDLLRGRFIDPFVVMKQTNDVHCSNKRIDYVMASGAYIPIKYEACFREATPSDHPFVLVTFEAGDL
jgi:hypothetical protein